MLRTTADVATAGLVTGCAVVLMLAGRERATGATWPPQDYQDLLALLSIGAGAAVLCWLLLGMAAAAACAVLARTGHHRLAARSAAWSPAFMRRLAGAVVGLNLVVIAGAHAAAATRVAEPAAGTGTSSAAVVDPRWQPDGLAGPVNPPVDASWKPAPPAAAPGAVAKPPTRDTPDKPRMVTVTAGDSLWRLAAAELGPLATDVEIAERWPEWYAANRALIGHDPSLIKPGQTLVVPPPG